MEQNQNYVLDVSQYGRDKWYYQIIDTRDGQVVAKRTSKRHYVAATVNGENFFGRLDLIGKGEHGRLLAQAEDYKVNTREKYEKIIRDRIREIRLCNRMHLDTFRKYSTQERLNAPLEPWQREHLIEFFGQQVADSVKTQWEYQVTTTNDDRDIDYFLKSIGDYETWKERREAWVEEHEPGLQVAYLQK